VAKIPGEAALIATLVVTVSEATKRAAEELQRVDRVEMTGNRGNRGNRDHKGYEELKMRNCQPSH
jgi:hypothetical protein